MTFVSFSSGYSKEAVSLTFTQLNFRYVHCLNLSRCKVSNSLYSQLAFTCPVLSVSLLKIVKRFLRKHLKHLNVGHNSVDLSISCITELLKNSNNRLLWDIQEHHSTEFEFPRISKEHLDTLASIVDLHDYIAMLY